MAERLRITMLGTVAKGSYFAFLRTCQGQGDITQRGADLRESSQDSRIQKGNRLHHALTIS